jgi:hypothetical protein
MSRKREIGNISGNSLLDVARQFQNLSEVSADDMRKFKDEVGVPDTAKLLVNKIHEDKYLIYGYESSDIRQKEGYFYYKLTIDKGGVKEISQKEFEVHHLKITIRRDTERLRQIRNDVKDIGALMKECAETARQATDKLDEAERKVEAIQTTLAEARGKLPAALAARAAEVDGKLPAAQAAGSEAAKEPAAGVAEGSRGANHDAGLFSAQRTKRTKSQPCSNTQQCLAKTGP